MVIGGDVVEGGFMIVVLWRWGPREREDRREREKRREDMQREKMKTKKRERRPR